MKCTCAWLLFLAVGVGLAQDREAPLRPLDRIQVLGLLAGSVFDARVAKLVEQRGIAFGPTEGYLQSLRACGAKDVLLEAVRSARRFNLPTTKEADRAEEAAIQYLVSGAELVLRKSYAEAEREYRAALQANPSRGVLHLDLGYVLLLEGRFEDALAEAREAVHQEPDDPDLQQKLGTLLNYTDDVDQGIFYLRQVVRLDPEYADGHLNLGAALRNHKRDFDGAISEYREALRLEPGLVDVHYNIGEALQAKGDREGAIYEFREEIRLNPTHVKAHYNLAVVLGTRWEDFEGAVRELSEVIRLDPGAVRELSEVVRLVPNNTRMRFALALALSFNRQPAAAVAELLKIPTVALVLLSILFLLVWWLRSKRRKLAPVGLKVRSRGKAF